MSEPGSPFPSCTTQHSLPEPDCDNAADGVLTVMERSSGDVVREQLICQPCVEREIRGWKMQPDGYCWTLIYQSFKAKAKGMAGNCHRRSPPAYPETSQ